MTKKSIMMHPLLLTTGILQRVSFETDPYTIAAGVLRNIQKYCVILLTNAGTDKLHPRFGTELACLPLMNIHSYAEIRLFISDQIKAASEQFFTIQNTDRGLSAEDILISVELVSINITDTNKISIVLKFNPKTAEAITLSLRI